MAMLEMLAEMVCAEKLLARVAFAELVNVLKMACALFPVLVVNKGAIWISPCPGELVPAVTTCISFAWPCRTVVERPIVARQRRTRPAVTPDMERVLVPLCFVFVLEAVSTKATLVLLFCLV